MGAVFVTYNNTCAENFVKQNKKFARCEAITILGNNFSSVIINLVELVRLRYNLRMTLYRRGTKV